MKITIKERDDDYEKLQNLTFNNKDKLKLSKVGNKVSNYYFQKYRYKTKYRNRLSHYEAWNNKEHRKKIILFAKKIIKTDKYTEDNLRASMRFLYGSINQFKPYVAVYIYQKFKPNRILDISAGWGDRLIAALSQDINYIGIDSNKKLINPYKKMLKDFEYKTNSKYKIIFNKSENINYSKLPKYDMIFTSPPYFDIEKYEGMTEYENKDDFINNYFLPTIKNSYKYLEKNGYMVLNIPEELYKILKKIFGKAKYIKMPIHNRFINVDKTKKYEKIYYWKKN